MRNHIPPRRTTVEVASSDPRASDLDESQYEADQGPCLHTLTTGEIVPIDDLDRETRWPIGTASVAA